jgi:uncharacterized protein (DUF305 family)
MFNKAPLQALAIMACLLALPSPSFAHEGSTMKKCMPMVHTGDADADFIKNMIPHHQMAIDMAKKELKEGKNDEARDMAQKIIDAQQEEISKMQGWLKEHKEMSHAEK